MMVGGQQRTFAIEVPRDSERAPLVLVLHGNNPGGGGRDMREWTTFDKQAGAFGFAVAYPDGVGGCWADGRGVTTADEANVADVAFLRGIIDWSAERHGTAADRTVVAGMSNGAFMAQRLAVESSDRVAVLAAVVATMPAALADRQPTHAVSAMLMHGDADTISPIDGGYSRHRGPNGEPRGRTLSLDETVARWRGIDRCAPGPGDTVTTEQSSRTTTPGGVGGTRVVAWTMFGAGHIWPGSSVRTGQTGTDEFDAAEEICRFAVPLLISATDRRLP